MEIEFATQVRRAARAAAMLALLAVAGCAAPPSEPAARAAHDEANDPLEPMNRSIFEFNTGLDKYFLKPVATAYSNVPEPMRDALRNFLRNLRSPLILTHDLLQGEPRRAGLTAERFLLNTTVGAAGFYDFADAVMNVGFHDEDFGQTLAVWGTPEGPYLVLPLIGPSNARDAGGLAVDSVGDPVSLTLQAYGYGLVSVGRFALGALDQRTRALGTLDTVKETSIDYYASLRSLYRQRRQEDIRNGRPGPPPHEISRGTDDSPIPSGAPAGPTPSSPPAGDDAPVPAAVLPAAAAAAPAAPPVPPAVEPEPPAAQPVAAAPADAASARAPAAQPPCGQVQTAIAWGEDLGQVFFANGSSVLSPEARRKLLAVARKAQQSRAFVHVVGHASERTGEIDPVQHQLINFEMSWLRAAAAGDTIQKAGIPWNRLIIEARSDQEPLCTEIMPSGEAANRRVAIYLE
ncbi:MAG: VacJ family lipoprotein [Alphaproteobacteria bacterium]|nr:VacJ family lipoprotein [Alphaproteobacteria bacterium]